LQSYPTTDLNERMWQGVKTYCDHPTYFQGVRTTPTSMIYAPGDMYKNYCYRTFGNF